MVTLIPIIITTHTRMPPISLRKIFKNYKRAKWPLFTEQTEQQFLALNSIQISNIDTKIAHFNSVIKTDGTHVPRGNRKSDIYPNLTPEIDCHIKQRDRLKFNSTLPFTYNITTYLKGLNNEIRDRIK